LEKKFHNFYVRALSEDKLKAVMTVSLSTKQDLVQLRYCGDRIYVVYNSLNWKLYEDYGELYEEKENLIICIERIVPYK